MTSYQFEVAAKNAIIDTLNTVLDDQLKISDLDFVWFSHTLANKKCMVWGPKLKNYYVEVTYSHEKHEMYIDVYNKEINRVVPREELNFGAAPAVPHKGFAILPNEFKE